MPTADVRDMPVVFCPDEDEVAVRYAPNFSTYLYRRMLEEYACRDERARQ